MTKKRAQDQGSKEFSHNPFKALKGFRAKEHGPVNEPPRPVSPAGEHGAEELFLESMRGVKQLEPGARPPGVRKTATRPAAQGGAQDRETFLHAMKAIGATTFRETSPVRGGDEERRSPSSRMKQLKRGTIRISGELNLHGFLKEEALRRLEHFIAGAHHRAEQAVLVITGKGTNSPGGPVLQGAAAEWLRTAGKGMVAEFHPAPRDKGGSGAFVVFLKSRR